MRLVQSAAEHPVSVLMVFAALLIFGIVCFTQLPQELMPDIPQPHAKVICEYPGLPAAEIEDLITIPIENALSAGCSSAHPHRPRRRRKNPLKFAGGGEDVGGDDGWCVFRLPGPDQQS